MKYLNSFRGEYMIKRLVLGIALATAFAVAGCSLFQTASTVVATASAPVGTQTLAQAKDAVYAAKSSYGAALVAMTDYARLPRCGAPTSPPICSSQPALNAMEQSRKSVSTAINTAEAAVLSTTPDTTVFNAAVAAAQQAYSALVSILNNYGVKV